MGEYNDLNIGDIVYVQSDQYKIGAVGVISDPKGETRGSKFRTTYRFPVKFAGHKMPRWFSDCECTLATEAERKRFFKDCLRG